ncbi:MAG: OB-fold nucleic acid binding domain-containing protein [Rikenellaceae bacterium]|nr:OB-fold nucleic acid binding domain-containing protein [Rikenellaceae bacterium]
MYNPSKWITALAAVLLAACSNGRELSYAGGDDDGSGSGNDGPRAVSIAYLKSLYQGYPLRFEEDLTIEGVVVANDRNGNYYKTLVVSDGTGGIEVKADYDKLFEVFRTGQTVRIGCNGLALGAYGGLVQLGDPAPGDYETGYIPEGELAARIVTTDKPVQQLLPETATIGGLLPRHVCTYVAFEAVQFVAEEAGLRWSEADADTDRHLIDARGDTLRVRTNHRADFAGRKLPAGSGYIEGIVGWFNGRYQLRIIDVRNVVMEEPRFGIVPD